MKRVVLMLLVALAGTAWGLEFDANGKRLDPEPDRQREYQWKDPRTGQTVTKAYPPANLKMRQVGRSADGWVTYLEVEGQSKFEDAVNLSTPKSVQNHTEDNASHDADYLAAKCLDYLRDQGGYKDPDSLKVDGKPRIGFTSATGEVRKRVFIMVNGKNSYGAYAGAKPVTCVIGVDDNVIAAVQ